MTTIHPKSQQEWRQWLIENHDKELAVWVVYYKKKAGVQRLEYTDAVDEALCFGWIDSKAKPIDHEKYMQYFCRRKPKSVWSKINKAKVARLIEARKMTEAGLRCIDIAKQNGSWIILDEAEEHIVPNDLDIAFQKRPKAKKYFDALSRSDRRNILQWLVLAKRPETRAKRIAELVELADQGLKPKQFR